MTSEEYIRLGRRTALNSFLLGTGIFGLYFLSSADGILFLGYGFIVITGLINIGVLISILVRSTKDNNNSSKLNCTAVLMLFNIPVMLVYCWISIMLLNTMRVTFTNSTQTVLSDINILGCEPEHLDKLDVGESKTVWVDITGDCTINIDYLAKGHRIEENVADYVTNNMGQKMHHNIGGENGPL